MAEYTQELQKAYRYFFIELCRCINIPDIDEFKEMLEALLALGFPINFQDKDGCTLLMESCSHKMDAAVVFLLDHGADPNIATEYGDRPLDNLMLERCPVELLDRLIKAGADLDVLGNDGYTAFNRAARDYIYSGSSYKLSVAQLLLEHGADPYLCHEWMKAYEGDEEMHCARRQELQELSAAYLTTRNETKRREDKSDTEAFMR